MKGQQRPAAPKAGPGGLVDLAALSDGKSANLRNEALTNGRAEFAAEVDRILASRSAPDLYRHSRRRDR